jgi:hypothetical protein
MMAKFEKTPSAVNPVYTSRSDFINRSDWEVMIFADFEQKLAMNMAQIMSEELMQPFAQGSMDQYIHRVQGQVEDGGVIPLSNDSDDALQFDNGRPGFSYQFAAETYRSGVKWPRNMEEDDKVGIIQDQLRTLPRKFQRTLKFYAADVLNRGIDDGTGGFDTAFLCADGMALVDSARVNPDPAAPKWSNLESTGALSVDLFQTAEINANENIGENGDRLYQKIDKVWVPLDQKRTMTELMDTQLEVDSANNNINYANKLMWEWDVIPELDSGNVYYRVGEPNADEGLVVKWMAQPSVEDWPTGNTDVEARRIRFAMTIGCFDPRYTLRGGKIT